MMKELGKLLKENRIKQGITQKQVGQIIGYSASMIGTIESGNRTINHNRINDFARIYKIDRAIIEENNILETRYYELDKKNRINIANKTILKKYNYILKDIQYLEKYVSEKIKTLEKEIGKTIDNF